MITDKENSDSTLLNDLLSGEGLSGEPIGLKITQNANETPDLIVILQHSQVGSWLIKLPGLRWAQHVYEETQLKLCQDEINYFDNFDFIPDDTKMRIRPRVIECITQIDSYEAWGDVVNELYDWLLVLSSIISLIITISVTPIWFQHQRTLLEWILVYIVIVIFVVLLLAFSAFILDRILEKHLYILAFIASVVAVLLVVNRLNWLPAFIQDGIRAGFIGYSIFIWLIVSASGLRSLIRIIIWRRKITLYPEEEIVQTLCHALALIKNNSDKWYNFSFKSNVMYDIEWVAKRIEKELPRSILVWDYGTRIWMQNCAERIAAHVRQLKQCILLPKQEARDTLIQALTIKLICASEGHFGSLEQSDFQVTPSRRSRLLSPLRAVATIGFPILIVTLIAVSPVKLDDSIRSTITTAAIGWGILSILDLIEPKTGDRISSLKTTLDLIPKGTNRNADN